MEEARDTHYGTKMAFDCGYRRLIVENDSLPLITKLKMKTKLDSVLGFVLDDISMLARSFDFCSFSHVKREGNTLAHEIAKFNFNNVYELVWLEDFPDFAIETANRNMLNLI